MRSMEMVGLGANKSPSDCIKLEKEQNKKNPDYDRKHLY